MKIEPKLYDDDEYDDETYRYWESPDRNEGYFYEIYILADGEEARVVITDYGVSVDFRVSGKSIHTNIVPNRLHPGVERLNWGHLERILRIVRDTDLEGKTFSKQEMDDQYQEWKDLGEP